MFRPFDDADKLRSLNLSMFVIVEASETDPDTFHQLKTRLRSHAAFTSEYDWRRGIIETNPSAGWVRSDVLLNASSIQQYGSTMEHHPDSLTPDPNISAHIASTDSNKYLPPNFINELAMNKPAWWTQKFIYGSFLYSEGLVYPSGTRSIVPYFQVPKHWKRLVACDYGLADKFTFVAAAIDPDTASVYIYKNEATNNKSIKDLSEQYYQFIEDIPNGALYTSPILDPKSGAKRDYNKKTLYDHFLDYGIYFQPGHIQLDARVFRVNTYLEAGTLKIMDNCTELIEEIQDYKFPERTLSSRHNSDKPMDKNNHSINPLEWICMALPADPSKLTLGSYHPSDLPIYKRKENYMWQLEDNQVSNPLNSEAPFVFNLFN